LAVVLLITLPLQTKAPEPEFFAAEDYHQQYLAKNPDGYCGLGGTGVVCVV
jgi:peptide-methionine (S)-S-oxide reductase